MPTATKRPAKSSPRPRAVDPLYIKATEEFRDHEIFLFREVQHRLHVKIEGEMRKRNGVKISLPLARVLHEISIDPGLSNAQLARRLNVTAQSMNGMVVALEREGYIERAVDPENARVLRCYALPAGVTLMRKGIFNASAVFDSVVGVLSGRDRAELRRLLKLLMEKIHVDADMSAILDDVPGKTRARAAGKRRGSR